MKYIRSSIMAFIGLTIICGIIYPLIVTGISQLLFNHQANGSIIIQNGQAIGSSLIGQQFTQDKYFWSRPSATGNNPYNALASGGSNMGPLNPALLATVKDRAAQLQKTNPNVAIPADLVTASGSGLDPEISLAAAYFQIPRVAKARGINEDILKSLIQQYAKSPILGFLGENRINVLELNLALDNTKGQ